MKKKMVLLTGASGFTGWYVRFELERAGYDVVDSNVNLKDYNKTLDLVSITQPRYVIHLAAVSFVGHGDVKDIYETNLIGTINLLKALSSMKYSLEKVVIASSANIYGSTKHERIAESMQPKPSNHYGVSKYAMEMACGMWLDELPILIVRPFNYTGVGQAEHFIIPKIVKHYKSRLRSIELGNVDVYRDFSDVRNVASWYAAALNFDDGITHVNFCSGVLTSLRDIIGHLSRITGYEIEIEVNPDFVRAGEIKRLCGDNSLLRELIGNMDMIPIEKTLSWMINKWDS